MSWQRWPRPPLTIERDEAVLGMLKAWVLIQTEVGRAGEVAAAVTAIDGVELSEVTAGPFDVIAKVQAPSLDALGRLIVSRVQAVPGTLRTLTCPRPGPDRPED
jgi:DNA-binding Lrp family transcriptional regulator